MRATLAGFAFERGRHDGTDTAALGLSVAGVHRERLIVGLRPRIMRPFVE